MLTNDCFFVNLMSSLTRKYLCIKKLANLYIIRLGEMKMMLTEGLKNVIIFYGNMKF